MMAVGMANPWRECTEDEAKAVAEEYLNQTDEVLDISLQWISYDDLDLTEDVYNSLVEKVKKYGLNDNPPTYEEFVLTDF